MDVKYYFNMMDELKLIKEELKHIKRDMQLIKQQLNGAEKNVSL